MKNAGTWLEANLIEGHEAQTDPMMQALSAEAKILVTDDDARMRQSLQDLLGIYGFECVTADGGESALELLASTDIDLLLLDLNMPNVDGYQVLQHIQKDFPKVDVIIVSGETTFDSATRAFHHGVRNFLRKPYVPEDLVNTIRNVLHKRELEQRMSEVRTQLEISEKRHSFIINNSPDFIYMLDKQGRFTFVNERIQTLLGYPRNELIGRHYTELVYWEDLEKARFAFDERRTGNRATQNVELRLVCKDTELGVRYFDSHSMMIELNSMGVYSSSGETGASRFIGTYGVARDITERKHAEELINFQLYHDLLTKLPNRALFHDRVDIAIAQARRNNTSLAIMYLDMDRFKVVNDSLGHLMGDQLLQMVAGILKGCLRDSDTLARVGGDEFNLLLPDIGRREDVYRIADKILNRFKEPINLEGFEVFVSFSIGISVFPEDGENIESLVKNADTAMYYVKGRGKNGAEFFNEEMNSLFMQHLALENELRKALEEDQLMVYYQPQYDMASGKLAGVEALIRWQHPINGLILPGEFIPMAEETGLIVDVGRWVLDRACHEIRSLYPDGDIDIVFAVNISALQLLQADFVPQVLETLTLHDIPPHNLEIEITENVLMEDMEQAVSKLTFLASKGIKIAVDDFGIGYSSLSYLQHLPLNTLKVDRSFVMRIESPEDKHSIVTAIVAMAKELRFEIVAEGIENDVQHSVLKRMGCDRGQGFLLGRPMDIEKTREALARDNTTRAAG
jgi:diguanylate cyclase (GGDEF)-like protein/PAS domain S-box-containing protein